jgi:1,4-dihydroxy-2-naphthoyl-CoA hydrolase
MADILWKKPVSAQAINTLHFDTAVSHLGIEFTEVGPDYMVARMPVDRRTLQPHGRLHGGAMVLLAETLASCGANYAAGEGQVAVGLEINANHLRAARAGHVTGTCRALHIGRTTQVWQIEIRDDSGALCCIARMTAALVAQ